VTYSGVKLPLAIDRHGEQPILDAWVVLPEPTLGVIELRLRTVLPPAELAPTTLTIPLASTADARWDSQRLAVQSPFGWQAKPLGASWRSIDGGWESSDRADSVRLELARDGRPSAVVERAWIQTRWSSGQQHTRAVYRLVSPLESFPVRFTDAPRGLLVWVDGQPLAPREVAPLRYELRLGQGGATASRVVELTYSTPDTEPWSRALAPLLDEGVITRRLHWHLPGAGATRLGAAPEGFLDESVWTLTPWGFERRSPCDASTLERWAGARADAGPTPADAGYLFSASEYRTSLEPNCWARSRHLLAASALSLSIGLALLFLPAWRRTILWTVALALTLALALAPAATLEWLQASVLGAVLATIAAILERRQALRAPLLQPTRGSSVSRPDSSTRIRTLPPVSGDALREAAEPSSESRR
jgi:hypothetical protein